MSSQCAEVKLKHSNRRKWAFSEYLGMINPETFKFVQGYTVSAYFQIWI